MIIIMYTVGKHAYKQKTYLVTSKDIAGYTHTRNSLMSVTFGAT